MIDEEGRSRRLDGQSELEGNSVFTGCGESRAVEESSGVL
jgi:hypothetical protein